jgi:hypothetical protein
MAKNRQRQQQQQQHRAAWLLAATSFVYFVMGPHSYFHVSAAVFFSIYYTQVLDVCKEKRGNLCRPSRFFFKEKPTNKNPICLLLQLISISNINSFFFLFLFSFVE